MYPPPDRPQPRLLINTNVSISTLHIPVQRYAVVRSPPAAAAGVGEVAADGVEGEVSSGKNAGNIPCRGIVGVQCTTTYLPRLYHVNTRRQQRIATS